MKMSPSLPAFLGLLGLLVSAPARAEYPLLSSAAAAGAATGSQAYRLAQNPAGGDVYAAGVLSAGAGNLDIWLARYSPELVMLSSYTYDKAGFNDAAFGVAVDTATGDVFAAGYVSSGSASSARDIWLARFNSSLVLQSSVTVDGLASDRDEAANVRVSGGGLYVVGVSSQPGGKGFWLARYDTSLVLVSSGIYYQNNCEVSDFLPTAGGTFVAGSRASNFGSSNDAWIGKFDANHVFVASAAVNGPASQTDHFHGLAEDGSGGVFAVGYVYSGTMADQYIAHYDASLVRTASAAVNGPGNGNEALGAALRASSGNLLVGGSYSQVAGLGGVNLYLAEYDSSLNKLSSTSYASPGGGGDFAAALLIGANLDVYAAGYAADGGSSDIWLGRFSTAPAPSVPAGLAASGVGLGAATIGWAQGGNPPGAVYQLERSTGTGFGLRQSSTALSFVDAALSPASTYYYRVRALVLAASAYSSTIAVATPVLAVYPALASIAPSTAAAGTSVAAAVTGSGFDASASLSLERTAPGTAVWAATASFTTARQGSAIIKLRDGRALLAGGQLEGSGIGRAQVDVFALNTGAWSAAAPLNVGRYEFPIVMLADGRVLVSGGQTPEGGVGATAEIYDPASGAWTPVASMSQARKGHRLALLPDGRVLAMGGVSTPVTALLTAELYDPVLNAWSAAPSMSVPRGYPTAVTLADGKVLVAGGRDTPSGKTASAQLYDPAANTWTETGPMSIGRSDHEAVLLPDGRVLIAGGLDTVGESASGDVYDPATSSWTATGLMGAQRRAVALTVVNGAPMAIGGQSSSADFASTDLYDAATNAWSAGPSLTGTRTLAAAVVLDDGKVLVAGGRRGLGGGTTLNTAERLDGPTASIAATGVSVPDALHVNGSISLTGAATGYWDAVVRESGGRIGRLSGGVLVAPGTPPAPALVSIAVTPAAATIPTSSSTLFTAIGTFSDGSTRTLNGTWGFKAPLNELRTASAGAFSDGKLYVLGGASSPGMPLGTFSSEAYDPTTDSWTYRSPSPVRRGYAAAAENAGKIYVLGGCVNSDCSNPSALMYEYDTVLDAWAAKASLPNAVFEATLERIGGKLYAAGGALAGYVSTNTLREYDPVANTWTTKAPMPYPRGYAASGVIDGKLYMAGGHIDNGAATGDELQIYDPVANAWTLGAPMPSGRQLTGGAVVNGRLYVIAGDHDQFATSSTDAARVQIYDPASNSWLEGPALQVSRYSPTVGAYQGKIYAAAAAFGNVASTAFEVLNPDEAAWSSNAPAIGTVTAGGSATGLAPGPATITASSGAVSGFAALTVYGPPAPPGAFDGAALSTGSILWSWTDASSDEAGFRIMLGGADISGDLAAGATTWLQTGLSVNASTGALLVRAFNAAGTGDSVAAARYSLAAPPSGLAASDVGITSATLSWSAGDNPAATVFALERSTGTGFGLRVTGASTSYLDAALIPGAVHFYRVRALNGDGVPTAYSSTASAAAASWPGPGASGTPAGTALGTSSVTWSWTLAADATGHFLYRASDDAIIGSSAAAPFIQTGLTPNAAYGLRVAGFGLGGTGPLSGAATVYTLAAPPTGGAAVSITSTALVASWALGANPPSTLAVLERSLDEVVYSTLAAAAATSYADADLLGCTTYHYRVRNLNGDGAPTAYASFQGLTANTVPAPPSGLTASANAGGTIGLSWSLSPTEGVTGYRLYWDAGTGTVSYAAPLAVLTSTDASYTTGVLASSAAYTFVLRTAHRCGDVETAGASAMSGAALAAAEVRAAIKEPDSGRRVNGNRVTILGELIAGTPADVQQVVFQYKLDASTAWVDVEEANLNHPNPDFLFPYFVHIDVTVLAPGAYDLRAVAYNRDGAPDPAPPSVRVVVDPVTPDISETRLVDGTIKKEQTVSNAVTSVIDAAGAGAADPAVRVTIPVGAVNSTTATVSVISNPAITTAAPAGQSFVGSAIKINLSNGQSALNGTAEITLTYPGTVPFPSLLQIFYLNEATGQWSRDFNSVVDTASRTVSGRTPHFSTFAIMLGTAFAADLSKVRVYPVPFKPNGSNPDEGRPFTSGDANSGIIFANMAAGSEIRIYTLTGRLVASLDSPSIAGTVRWDARNQDGRDVASGAYFAVISAAGQKNAVKKLVIIR